MYIDFNVLKYIENFLYIKINIFWRYNIWTI